MTDQSVNLQDFKKVLTTVLERFYPETDLFIFSNLSYDTLDYTGPSLNKGSRGILAGIGEKIRSLPSDYHGSLPSQIKRAHPFCPGCLVIEGPSYADLTNPSAFTQHPSFATWPLIVLVDDLSKTLKNTESFLWTTFTRFEPAADIYSSKTRVHRHHLCYELPLLIDARMKPWYPPEVKCDPDTASLVKRRWENYFPQGMEQGDSDSGHVC